MARDPFDIPSGEFTEDFTGSIKTVEFPAGDYGTQAKVIITRDEPVAANDGTLLTEKHIYLRVPRDWTSRDGGLTLDRVVDGMVDEDAKITRRSQWGDFIGRLDDLGVDRRSLGLTAYSASAWENCGVHGRFETVKAGEDYTLTDRDTGEKKQGKTKGYVAMTELLGVAGTNGQAPKAFNLASLGLPDETVDILMGLAQAETPAKFQTDAVAHRKDATDLAGFMEAVTSGQLYEALR